MMFKKIYKKFIIIILLYIKFSPFLVLIRFRGYLYSKLFLNCAGIPNICDNVTITLPENIEIGSKLSIHENSTISAHGGISIGSNVSIGSNCIISSSNHNFKNSNIPFKQQGINLQKVTIGNNVWIGASVTILAGVKIGNNCIIGAGSVVIKNIDSNSIAIGSPAKKIKDLYE